jgi:hypothetical protein
LVSIGLVVSEEKIFEKVHDIHALYTLISKYLKKKHLLKFFRQNNYTEKAKILYFVNLVYFLSLVDL